MTTVRKFGCCLFAAVCGSLVASAKSASDYVQSGLVAQWDGVENAGPGLHLADTTKWVDLVKGVEVELPAWVAVEGTSLYSTADKSHVAKTIASIEGLSSSDATWTIEIVQQGCGWRFTDNFYNLQGVFSTPRGQFGFRQNKDNGFYFYGPSSATQVSLQDWNPAAKKVADLHTMSAVLGTSKATCSIWMDGVKDTVNYNAGNTVNNPTVFSFFGNPRMDIRVYSIRVYNRSLSTEEVAANRAVDVARFVDGDLTSPDRLLVTGFPEPYGEPNPAYGATTGLNAGGCIPCSAPVAWTNEEGTVAASCAGFTVYTNDVIYLEGEGSSFKYEHPDCETGARLVWNWAQVFKVSVSATAGGAVSTTGMLVKEGDVIKITAAANEGNRFVKWTGDVPSNQRSQNPLELTVDSVKNVTAVFASANILDYVTDGLVALWDGIDNSATGTHDPVAKTWVDLVSGREFVLGTKTTIKDDSLFFPAWDAKAVCELSAEDTDETFELAGRGHGTVEICLNGRADKCVALQAPGGVLFYRSGTSSIVSGGTTARPYLNWYWEAAQTNTVSICYDNTVPGDAFVDGVQKSYSTWQTGRLAESGDKTVLGNNQAGASYTFNNSSIFAIRVYNRKLMPEERQQNAWADQARFQGVVHIPVDAGSAFYTGKRIVSLLTDTEYYTVEENDGGTDVGTYPVKIALVDKEKLQWDDGTTEDKTLSFTIREPVIIEPSDDDWLAIQTAIDNARWCDEIRLTAGTFSLTNTLTMTKPVTLRGANRETTILDYAKKCQGFSLSDERAIVCDLTVTNCYVSKVNGGAVTLSRGVVSNCLLTACSLETASSGGFGGGVYMTGGKVLDCTFVNCAAGGVSSKGAGVYMEGGTVSNCTFRGCKTGTNASGGCGGWIAGGLFTNCRVLDSTDYKWCSTIYAIYVKGGTVRNTLISGIFDDTATSKATTITPLYLASAGVVENCTVAGNDPGSAKSPAATMTGGTLVNTIIWGNNASQQLKQTGGTVSYCCYPEATEGANGNTARDPRLRKNRLGQLVLRDGSSAIDAATPLDWMTPGATDVYGNPRVKRGVPDMGCAEWQPTGLMLIVR